MEFLSFWNFDDSCENVFIDFSLAHAYANKCTNRRETSSNSATHVLKQAEDSWLHTSQQN